MQTIQREEVKEKMSAGAVLVDVLSADKFREYHIAGAINIPIGHGFNDRIQAAVPDKDQEVVLYCYDEECSASPKAGERMEELGYSNVYDYSAGKVDWKEAGLPVES